MSKKEEAINEVDLLDPNAVRESKSPIKTVNITKLPVLVAGGFFLVIMGVLVSNSNNNAEKMNATAIEEKPVSSSRSDASSMVEAIAVTRTSFDNKGSVEKKPLQGGIQPDRKAYNVIEAPIEELSEQQLALREYRNELQLNSLSSEMTALQGKIKPTSVNSYSSGQGQGVYSGNSGSIDNSWLSDEQERVNRALANNNQDRINASSSQLSTLGVDTSIPPTTETLATLSTGFANGTAQNNSSKYGRDWNLGNEVTPVPNNPFRIQTGSVINGILQTEINSDLAGMVTAMVSQNVYDSVTGKYLLIPQGSRLVGQYGSEVDIGQRRLYVAWNRVLFPDGRTLDIGSMSGANTKGQSGFSDKVNTHFWRNMGSAVMLSLIGATTSHAIDRSNNNNNNPFGGNNESTFSSALASNFASQIGQVTTEMIQQGMNMSPTLEIRAGYRFNIMISKDIVFEQPYNYKE